MNLIKNVEGDWNTAKLRVRQDLDSIQRYLNGLQADLKALTTVVTTPAPVPAAIISAANHVTVPTGDFLSTVAVGSGLTGDGRAVNPLIATGTPLTLAASSALAGLGTVGSPLAVTVDGVTMTINGSNQLATLAGNSITIVTQTVTGGAFQSAGTGTPITMIPAVSNKVAIIIGAAITYRFGSPYGSSPTWRWRWAGDASTLFTLSPNVSSFTTGFVFQTLGTINTIVNDTARYTNKAVVFDLSGDPGSPTSASFVFTTLYCYADVA